MSIILGVNFSHDASLVIIKNGVVLAAIEEEKVSRVKQDFGWPRQSIDRLFEEYKINKKDVAWIVFDKEIPLSLRKNEIAYRFTKSSSQKNKEYIDRITSYLGISKKNIGDGNEVKIKELIAAEGFTNAKIKYYDHHLSHAASAYYAAPIATDLVITSDGRGGDSAFNFYLPNEDGLQLIRKNDYTTSVGAFYSCITQLLGFRPTRHEGKITGLAAFGKPTGLVEKFLGLWKYEGDQLFRFPFDEVESLWNHYNLNKKISKVEKINLETSSNDLASDYARRSLILLEWLKEITIDYSKEDIAYACQNVAERITLQETEKILTSHFPSQRVKVALAGGVFANVRINQLIYELHQVDNIFVQPAMGDSGLALGNAILLDIEENGKDFLSRKYAFSNTYLGPDYSKDLEHFLKNFNDTTILHRRMENPAQEVAELIANNKIIGFWTGKMEWGPRALGNRSIILNTFDKSVNDTLNYRLNRTEFMPFAPVVLDKLATTYFKAYNSNVPAADYMTITYDTEPEFHELLQATVHVDGTARPQIASKEKSPLYYGILNAFYELTGCGALVNTSFNAHEQPIVNTPEVAIEALKTNRVDYLVMDNNLFSLKEQ